MKAPLWTLAVAFAKCEVAAIPNCALSTFTTGKVAIPSATSVESLITPVGVLEKPTSVTFTYSSSILRKSLGATEPIPLKTNCDNPIPIFESSVCVIDVNVTGCWTTPSKPIIVLVNGFVIVNLCALPAPRPVNVTAAPDVTYSGLVNNWNLFSSRTFAKTVLGKIVVTTPATLAVDPIDIAVAAIPMNVESGV